jgi:DNA-binding IclR family transcriptional regulator
MLRKAFDVLSLFTTNRTTLGVVEAAELLDRPTSTVSRWLAAMEGAGFLDRDGRTGRYRLGLRLIGFGEIARRSTFVHGLALPALHELTEETRETSTLGIRVGAEAFDAEVVESPHLVRPFAFPGRRYPLHSTSVGKALLAWLPEEEVRRLLPRRLQRHTPATVTSLDSLIEQLQQARGRGYATAWGEWAEDSCGAAAPVRDPSGKVLGVLSVAAPVSRVSEGDLPWLGKVVTRTADRVSGALKAGRRQIDEA